MAGRKLTEKALVLASHNSGKVRELEELLTPYGIKISSSADFNLDEPEETGLSFIENAKIKAVYTASKTNLPSLSDDSGLVIPALNGDPGIYSARWAGKDKDFGLAINRIQKELIEKTGTDKNHDAHFVCALCICWGDGYCQPYEGKVFGKLIFPPKGREGFGYDPIFIPSGYDITFGEMRAQDKHRISHRAEAFRQFVSECL